MTGSSGEPEGDANSGVFLLFALCLGLLCRNVVTKLAPIPYTVILLIIGFIIGVIYLHTDHHGSLGASTLAWVNVDPHTLLFLFLPTLIFESAFSLDYHIFRKSFTQMLTLAVPGLAVSTLLTAAVTVTAFHDTWDFSTGMMFGSILSATDPVAVVAMLKELGAPKSLSTLIEGESLLNDGTAIVVFTVFYDAIIEGEAANAGEITWLFIKTSLGGVLVGALFGGLAILTLSYIYNDTMSEITVTLVSCYATFIVAEGELHLSGVLAVVTLGVLMTTYGRVRVSSEVENYLHSFWEMMGYIANTVIFVLSGVIIAEKAIASDVIEGRDWGLLIALYFVLHVIRVLVVLLSSPILSRTGYPIKFADGVIVCWAGLRGAVGLALGLIVERDERIDHEIGDRIVFYVAGIAMLTLLINGTTMKYLVAYFGLDRKSHAKQMMFEHAAEILARKMYAEAQGMKEDKFLSTADWKEVWLYMPVHTRETYKMRIDGGMVPHDPEEVPNRLRSRWNRYHRRWGDGSGGVDMSNPLIASAAELATDVEGEPLAAAGAAGGAGRRRSRQSSFAQDKVLAETRNRYVSVVRSNYWHRFENGLMGPSTMRILIGAEAVQLDDDSKPLAEWDTSLHFHARLPSWHRKLYNVPILRPLIGPMTSATLGLAYDLCANFIQAHETAMEHSVEWAAVDATIRIRQESVSQIEKAQLAIAELESSFATITRVVKTKQVVRALLRREKLLVTEMRQNGALDEDDFELISATNNASVKKLSTHPPTLDLPRAARALASMRYFDSLSSDAFSSIAARVTSRATDVGEALIREGTVPGELYIVSGGYVRERIGESVRRHGPGHMCGAVSLMTGRPEASTVEPVSLVQLYVLRQEDAEALAAAHVDVRRMLWQIAGEDMCRGLPTFAGASPAACAQAFTAALLEEPTDATPTIAGADTLVHLRGRLLSVGGAPPSGGAAARPPQTFGPGQEALVFEAGSVVLRIPSLNMDRVTESKHRRHLLVSLHGARGGAFASVARMDVGAGRRRSSDGRGRTDAPGFDG